MKAAILGVLAIAGVARAEPKLGLAKRWGADGLDHGWGLAADARGNLVVSGFSSQDDGVLALGFGPAGRELWSWRQPLGLPFYAGPMALAADGAALLVGDRGSSLFYRRIVRGKLAGAADVEQASGLGVTALGKDVLIVGYTRPSNASFLLALAPDGAEKWRKPLAGDGVAVAGTADGFVVAGSRAGDVFVEKRTTDGAIVWTKTFGKPDVDERRAQLAVGAGGEILCAHASAPLTVTKLSPAGEVVWSRELPGGRSVGGVAVAPTGGVVVSGDDRVVWLTADGSLGHTQKLSAQEIYLQGVAIDARGGACVTGWFAGPLAGTKLAARAYDVLLLCYSR